MFARRHALSPLLFLLAVTLAGLSHAAAQGFSQGLLKSKRTVTLHRKLPATVTLKAGTLGIKAASRDKNNTVAVQKLADTLEAELLKNENHFKIDNAKPDIVVFCNITDLLLPAAKIVTRNVPTTAKVGKSYNTTQTPRQFYEVTGSINVAYEVKDTKSGRALDADNLTAKYAQEFDAGGNKTKTWKDAFSKDTYKKKSNEEKAEAAPPTPLELQSTLIKNVVIQVVARLATTDEKVDVRLARGAALDEFNDFADKGQWNRMLEGLDTMKPLDTPEDDAFRLYNLGVGYEALAYQAEDLKIAKKYLDQAAIDYGKATDANPHEKDFLDAQNRISTALAHYTKLGKEVKAAPEPAKAVAAKPDVPPPSLPSGELLTNAQVIEFVAAGLDEANLLAIIKSAKAVNFDMSVDGQMALVKGGVKGKVLIAMRERAHPAARRAPAKKPAAAPAASAPKK